MITTTGGGSISTSALTRAIQDFGAQAKKQLDETGSLAGFEGKFKDDSSGGGSVTISVSALGMAAYDASAGKDDTLLSFTMEIRDPNGDSTGGGTGASGTIRSDQDIEKFIAGVQRTTQELNFTTHISGPDDEVAAYSAAMSAAAQEGGVPLAVGGEGGAKQPASGASAALFDKLQRKQAASDQLVGLLQSFVDALSGKSKREKDSTDGTKPADDSGSAKNAESKAGNAIQSRLAQFAGTDVTT